MSSKSSQRRKILKKSETVQYCLVGCSVFTEVYNDHLAHFLTACYYSMHGGQK